MWEFFNVVTEDAGDIIDIDSEILEHTPIEHLIDKQNDEFDTECDFYFKKIIHTDNSPMIDRIEKKVSKWTNR